MAHEKFAVVDLPLLHRSRESKKFKVSGWYKLPYCGHSLIRYPKYYHLQHKIEKSCKSESLRLKNLKISQNQFTKQYLCGNMWLCKFVACDLWVLKSSHPWILLMFSCLVSMTLTLYEAFNIPLIGRKWIQKIYK